MIHYIYCYTNLVNKKQYIGQTNNLERRKKQHLQDSLYQYANREVAYNQPIHAAIRKYGINNFQIDVLEIIDSDNWDEVNKKESQYILEYNTLAPNGYNLKAEGAANVGGNKSKLNENTIQSIIQDLKNNVSQSQIAETYQISRSYVADINNGRCLKQQNEIYPLQKNRITEDEYLQIIDLLKNTHLSMREIARETGKNRDTIWNINNGKQQIVRALYNGTFPIRENARSGYIII